METGRISLNGTWRLTYADRCSADAGETDCRVPGNVELDLIAAGLLPEDIFRGTNIKLAEKYETYDWTFSRRFDCPDPQKRYRIVFEGVDCLAAYYINGRKIGESDTMLVEHGFDLPVLKAKDNLLQVKIQSAFLENCERAYPVKLLLGNWGGELPEPAHLRRAAHTYGWDILPRAVSAGLWRGVYLEEVNPFAFKQFFLETKCLEDGCARLLVAYEFACFINRAKGYTLDISGVCGESAFHRTLPLYFKAGSAEFTLQNPRLWWPYGYGRPDLYEVEAKLLDGDGNCLSTRRMRLGIRTVKLNRTDTAQDGKFAFIVNGTEIYVRGMNWIPLSPYHSQDAERLPRALAYLKQSKSNMVRCWGGNVYESEAFFNALDEAGILLWQDFSFACTIYPHTEAFYAKVRREAEKVIKRIRSHACLALWAGDNEIDVLYNSHLLNPGENYLTRSVLAEQVRLHDPWRAYLPSSPYMSERAFRAGGGAALPETHLWGARNWMKCDYYRKTAASFISEIGCLGMANEPSLDKFIPPEKAIDYFSEDWTLHSSDNMHRPYRTRHLLKGVKIMFGDLPSSRRELAEASQYYHAEFAKFVIENMRAQKPKKSGLIWWNLLDGWPGNTEALVDWYFVKKRAFDVVARSHEPFCLMIYENENGARSLVAVNDTSEEKQTEYTVKDGETGDVLYSGEIRVTANGAKAVQLGDSVYFNQTLWLIEWEEDGGKKCNHYLCGNPVFDLEKVRKWYRIIDETAQQNKPPAEAGRG